ncbi:MAG: TRAP dicarboxylate transporter subunit DctM [candidate division Zixibacteria bacterium SM1_73]|nr:MAG: TRAP dicarboxylate transporter subunit DctM [candidate division Zixibacteria bacterium SM1_73]
MSTELITFLLFAALVLLLITGLPLAFAMGGVAALFVLVLQGPYALSILSSITYGVMDNFILTAIPLFIFMGLVLQRSGVADDAYAMMYKWIGGIRGGLAMGTVGVCTIFAACTGISGAATVTMGVIALPAMLRYSYHKSIAVGCISAGGALGILIPPSVLMIVYGIFSGESIGQLYAGGVFPGLLLATLFIIYIAIRCYFQGHLGPPIPPEERATWREKLISLRAVILPMALIIIVLGTIFKGVCTPTEAAAIGCAGSLLCAAIYRKLNWTLLKESCYEGLRLSCMVLWIIIGGSCFASLYTYIGALEFIKGVVGALPVSPYLVLAGMQFSLFILGMLMDPGGIIMITVPIFVPIIKMLGFDAVWFGVLFIINMEMAYLTPPFGFNLFYMKAIVPKTINMMDIYKSIAPFVGLQAISLLLCILYPEIILWFPQTFVR